MVWYGDILAKIFVIELGGICDLYVVEKRTAIESRPSEIAILLYDYNKNEKHTPCSVLET